jgi:hypothetical protein
MEARNLAEEHCYRREELRLGAKKMVIAVKESTNVYISDELLSILIEIPCSFLTQSN